ncbi:MAG: ABC transporter permease [Actinomycetota bacterium]|nr:ABC transporter permease [Actinomycetota bacterium]
MSNLSTQAAVAEVEHILGVVSSARDRPPRPSALATSLTFAWRGLLKIKHVPEQLLDVTVFPVMMLLMFTFLFGGAVAGSTDTYLQDLLPGILVMQVTWISMYTGHTLNRDITKGVHDRFRSLPIWRPATLVGPLLADAARYTMASSIILALGLVLGFRPQGGGVGVLAGVGLMLVFSFSLSWAWTVAGVTMRSPEAVFGLGNLVMFPLTFVSNVFVPVESLPGWLQAFVNVNPISILVSGVRGLMHGTVRTTDIVLVLVISAALVAVCGPLTMYAYRRSA